jgi:hypothetical protein
MKIWLKVVGVNVALLLGGLLILELIFGNWVFSPDYREMNIPRNTVRVFDVDGLYAGGGQITYTRDRHGLRGPYRDIGAIDILTLGGSTTNQLYVDDAKTWQAVMRQGFEAAGKPRTIVNAAVDGQSTRGHIAVFERWFPLIDGLKARYILVYAAINDLAVDAQEKYDDMRSPNPARRFATAVKNKSAVYDFYKTVRGMLAAMNAQVVHGAQTRNGLTWEKWQPADARLTAPAGTAERLAAYAERLRKFDEKIRDFGAKAIFVTQPIASYRLKDGWLWLPVGETRQSAENNTLEIFAFNRVTLDVCRDIGAVCIDLASDLEFVDADFYDWVHYTDVGAHKVGEYLYRALKEIL